nr:PREDICTED: GAS2-like protein 2 [Lepisosteus oculatus]
MSGIHTATNRSIKPFKSSEEYLYAMKEDLAEWLTDLYGISIAVDGFLEVLETGSLLCQHANQVTRVAGEFLRQYGAGALKMRLPTSGVTFVSSAQAATFLARDNVSNFISWCRKEMDIKGREGFVGQGGAGVCPGKRQAQGRVQYLVSRCTCPSQFSMLKVSEGKYKVGDSGTLIFVRILRNHVMVRVGGGWDTLEHYLDKHDPCRCTSLTHKQARLVSPHKPVAPTHEIRARPSPQQDAQGQPQAALVVSRAQAPLAPVEWTPSAPARGLRPGRPHSPWARAASSPEPSARTARELRPPTPSRLRGRSATPTHRQASGEERESSPQTASSRTGREETRTVPSPRLASSLPRPAQPTPVLTPDLQRPKTPLVFQRAQSQLTLQPQQTADIRLAQTWSRSRLVSALKTNAASPSSSTETAAELQSRAPAMACSQRQAGMVTGRPATSVRSTHPGPKPELKTTQQPEAEVRPFQKTPTVSRSISPTKQLSSRASALAAQVHTRPMTPIGSFQRGSQVDRTGRKTPNPDASLNGESRRASKLGVSVPRQNALRTSPVPSSSLDSSTMRVRVTDASDLEEAFLNNKNRERECLFTPPPISPEQESRLYKSLEYEILSNLRLLGVESDNNSDENVEMSCGPQSKQDLQETSSRHSTPSLARKPPADGTSHQNEVSFDVVIAELSKGQRTLNKLDVENWVAKIPNNTLSNTARDPRTTFIERAMEMHAGHLNMSKANRASSWSSLGSSLECKEQTEAEKQQLQDPELFLKASPAYSLGSAEIPAKSRTPSFKQKRSLKKPERVPSIFKLKLRPKVRPRRDNRPEKRPSKIPTPVSHRQGQTRQVNQKPHKSSDKVPSRNQHSSHCSMPMLYSTEDNLGYEEDTWPAPPSTLLPESSEPTAETARNGEEESWV